VLFHKRIFAWVLVFITSPLLALSPSVHHPLDALTPQEYWAVCNTLHDAGKLQEGTVFSSVLLHEPAKSEVLAWKPGDPMTRRADVILLTQGKTYETVVNISARKLESYIEMKSAQAPLSESELMGYDDVIKHDPRFIAALKKRGITDLQLVTCFVTAAGYVGLPEQTDGRRIGWGWCVNAANATHAWDREIPGIFFMMDMNARKIVRFSDYGSEPMPAATSDYDADGGPALPGAKPFLIAQPEGPGFTVEDGEVTWQNWQFRFRLDPRVGPIVNLVTLKDGDKRRSVMYEGSLSEMYVPYQDPEQAWYSRVFMDAGEYFTAAGSGGLIKPLQAGVDCPAYATFFSGVFFHENGSPYVRPQIACLFERVTGDPAWRHWDEDTGAVSGRPARELVLRTVATAANYDYILDWRFEQNGSIEVAVGATGILEVKAVADAKDGKLPEGMSAKMPDGREAEFGQLVAPNIDGVNHDHFFNFRLDLDVDGQNNMLMVDRLVPYKLPDSSQGRHWIWAMQPEMAKTEDDAKLDVSLERPSMWRIANANAKNALGQPTSFMIMPGVTDLSLLPPDEWPQKRAGFSEHTLWVTPYEPNERYAAGVYVMGSKGDDSLAAWTRKNRNIMNADIVAWYTVGLHHVPRPEDWPQMPIMWRSFTLAPYGFFTKNPTMDLPMTP
jgi:primary-amine oxidase